MEVTDNEAVAAPANEQERKRFRSEIEFPYSDLESAAELAKTLHSRAGSSCALEELAAWMNQSANGGTFRTRVSAARMFGLIEASQGRATLTQLGHDSVGGSTDECGWRSEAFLNVQLFRAMYDKFRGNALPPVAAIERQMQEMGVSPKQKERARQTFMKSATFAGFIDPSSGRFIKPGNAQSKADAAKQEKPDSGNKGGGGGGGDLSLDPLLLELLKKIPPASEGWPEPQRLRWFRTFAMNVSQIYDNDNAPVEMNISVRKETTD